MFSKDALLRRGGGLHTGIYRNSGLVCMRELLHRVSSVEGFLTISSLPRKGLWWFSIPSGLLFSSPSERWGFHVQVRYNGFSRGWDLSLFYCLVQARVITVNICQKIFLKFETHCNNGQLRTLGCGLTQTKEIRGWVVWHWYDDAGFRMPREVGSGRSGVTAMVSSAAGIPGFPPPSAIIVQSGKDGY